MKKIVVATDFSRFPAGRFLTDGPFSGERFREDFLVKSLQDDGAVEIDLDGVVGYGSSFLEEAFGGAVRKLGLSSAAINKKIQLRSSDGSLIDEIRDYMNDSAS